MSILFRHLAMAFACIIWGLMAPFAKDAMRMDFTGIDMVAFRVAGGALCFWLTSWVQSLCGKKQEKVPLRDIGMFFLASLCGISFNQGMYTVGISFTSPVNASIMTTTLPIISLILSIVFLHERATWQKIVGIALALSGALMVILTSHTASAEPTNPYRDAIGSIMCVLAQCSFASYLVIFGKLIKKYSVVTCMKWMMLFATVTVWPFALPHIVSLPWQDIAAQSYWEMGFVVFFGTYCAYILMTWAQQVLRPTQVSIYNYFQPVISCLASVIMGLAVFGYLQAIAILLVFSGVYLVTRGGHKETTAKQVCAEPTDSKERLSNEQK